MTDILFPYKPRREDPLGFLPVQANVEELAGLFTLGVNQGDIPIWDTTLGRFIAMAPSGYGTSLPASPHDGKEFTVVDSTTSPTYQWTFRYNANSSHSHKWEFIGGTPKYDGAAGGAVINTATQVGATGYYYQSGMHFTVPMAGTYLIWGFQMIDRNGGADGFLLAGGFAGSSMGNLGRNYTHAAIADHVSVAVGPWPATGISASTVVGIAVNTSLNGTYKFHNGNFAVLPIRVS